MIEEQIAVLAASINTLAAAICAANQTSSPAEVTTPAPAPAAVEKSAAEEAAPAKKGRGRGNKKKDAEPASTPAPAPVETEAAAPATDEVVEDKPLTIDDAREVVMNVAQNIGRDQAAALVSKFGAAKLGELDAAVYPDLIAEGKKLLAA